MSALAERPVASARTQGPVAAARPWQSVTAFAEIAEAEAVWRALEARALVTPYQSFAWVEAFARTVGRAQGMVFRHVVVHDRTGAPQAILPFVITRRQGFRFAEFVGGKHANYHMGLFAPAFAAALDAQAARALLQEAAAAIGRLDAFVFVNQPVLWQGQANPLATLASSPSPSAAYKLALEPGDCAGTLRRAMSAHAHKKIKNKRNRLAGFGPSRLLHATTPTEIDAVLAVFLRQKAARFAAMGLADPFADVAVRAFLRRAAQAEPSGTPAIELHALLCADEIVATYVGAVQGTRFSGMATSFAMAGEIAKSSPGEILLVDLIKRKCQEGCAVFDLGVGEARYKTTICDDRDELVDSFLPLTAKGRLFSAFSRGKRAAKRWIKSHPRALRLAQRISGVLRRERPASAE